MTGSTNNDEPIKLLVVATGGEFDASTALASLIAERNYKVHVISPREAKEWSSLKPHNGIIPLKSVFPETHLYYPYSAVEPNRQQRRKESRNKSKKNGKR